MDINAGTWSMEKGGLRVSLSVALADDKAVRDALEALSWDWEANRLGVFLTIPPAACKENNLTALGKNPTDYLKRAIEAGLSQSKLPVSVA